VGLVVKFPDAGSQSVCDHCGANIYANDVFKKNKRPNRLTNPRARQRCVSLFVESLMLFVLSAAWFVWQKAFPQIRNISSVVDY